MDLTSPGPTAARNSKNTNGLGGHTHFRCRQEGERERQGQRGDKKLWLKEGEQRGKKKVRKEHEAEAKHDSD